MYEIKLSEEEAQVLADVLWLAGGDPAKSRRRLCENIRVALVNAGVYAASDPDNGFKATDFYTNSTFIFKDTKK